MEELARLTDNANLNTSASRITAGLSSKKKVSRWTAARALKVRGCIMKPCRKERNIKPDSKTKRIQYARAFKKVSFKNVLFTDSKYFWHRGSKCASRAGPNRWCKPGVDNTQKTYKDPLKVHVYAGISFNGKTPSVLPVTGSTGMKKKDQRGVNGAEYRRDVLPWFFDAGDKLYGPNNWTFMQDGASIHTAKATKKMLNEKCADPRSGPKSWLKSHPPESADLNPIENAWALVEHDVLRADVHCRNIAEYKAEVAGAWDRVVTQALMRKLTSSMRRRLEAVLKAKGGYTRY